MTTMIEHRLYSIETFHEHPRVKTAGYTSDKVVLMTPEMAVFHILQGDTVFDFTESLGMESEYYDEEQFCVIFEDKH